MHWHVPESWDGVRGRCVQSHDLVYFLFNAIESRKHCCCCSSKIHLCSCVCSCVYWADHRRLQRWTLAVETSYVSCHVRSSLITWLGQVFAIAIATTLPTGQQQLRRRAIAACLDIHARAPLQSACLVPTSNSQKVLQYPSHRILRYVHRALNVDKKK